MDWTELVVAFVKKLHLTSFSEVIKMLQINTDG